MNADQLLKPSRFCNVLAQSRSARVRGWWDGSAFRNHPCGLIVGNMRLANHWHVDDYCDIVLGTTDKWRLGQNEPAAYGDPFPHPIDGNEIVVWRNGKWLSDEFREALEVKIVSVLNRALADIAAAKSWRNAIEAHDQFCAAKMRAKETSAALALAVGGSA